MAVEGEDLAPFVSRLAAEWMASRPEERYRQLEGTLVSADLSGFTAMSERLAAKGKQGAEELTESINGCFTALIAAAAVDGGDVLKFGGDALLLWFDGDDHAVRAVRAAARMQQAIGAARFRRKGLAMSVGVHTGAFDMFLVGRADWRELVLAGQEVSTTVELEAAAGSGEVLVSEAVADRLPDGWTVPAATGAGLVLDAPGARLGRKRVSPRVVPSQVARRLVAPALQANVAALAGTGGEHRMATIVFAELEGTDQSVADVGPTFADSVDALVQATQDEAERYGLLFLYTDVIRDGIKLIVVAGAPVSTGDDEEAGLRFATELVGGDPKRKLRAGVNRGRIFAGFLGSAERRAYTVMGDPVNLAARLMVRAEPGEVYGSDDVVRAARAEFALTSVSPFLVKGRTEPVSAHLVGPPTGVRRQRTGGELPLVGREAEIAELRDAIASASTGAGQVIEIVGDAGIGKTRLLQAVAGDPRVLVRVASECQPYDSLSPFAGVRPLLRRALGVADAAAPALAGRQLVTTARRVAPAVVPMLPLVAVAIGAEVEPTPEASAIAEEFRQNRMHEAVIELLTAALPSTTMLTVEDVYYVDDASLQLLRALAAIVPERPWFMAITRRPEGPGLVVSEADGTLLKLAPLEEGNAARLADLAVGNRPVGSVDLQTMVQRAGGNPLFVLELVEASGAGVAADELPESIERLVATRVDRLAPDDRALLRQAAVAGRVFHAGLVNTLFATEGRAPVSQAQWARLGEFVEPDGDRRWRFRHALFRDVAYEGLPFARRKRMHRAVGELLEAGVGGEPDAALLSLHFWLAGDAERTWRYSVAAGDIAWRSSAVAEAIAAYRRALEVRRRVKDLEPQTLSAVAETLGDVLERAAQYDEADTAYLSARRTARRSDVPVRARHLRKRGVLSERSGDFAGAIRLFRRAMAELVQSGDSGAETDIELGHIELAMAGTRHRQGQHQEMYRLAASALERGRTVEARMLEGLASNLLQVAVSHGAGAPSVEFGERALAVFAALGDVRHQALAMLNIGIEQHLRGAWTEAVGSYQASAGAFLASGDLVYESIVRNNLAELLSDQGHYDDATEQWAHVRRSWQSAGYGMGLAVLGMNEGTLLVRQGAFEEGLALLNGAAEAFRGLGSLSYVAETQARVVETLILGGRYRNALALLEEIEAANAETELFGYTRAALHRLRGWGQLQAGDVNGAERSLRTALTEAVGEGSILAEALALEALAVVARVRGDPHADAYAAESEGFLRRLGVLRLPRVPLPF